MNNFLFHHTWVKGDIKEKKTNFDILKNMFDIIAITEQNHRLKRIYAKMSMQNVRLQKALGKQR